MQQPKRVKYRKAQRGRRRGKARAGNNINFGDFGLQALESAWLTSAQIEAARRAITRYIRRGGKVWIRVFPDKPVTKKPAETRMGSGKGVADHWVAVVRAGKVIFEMAGVGESTAREAIRLAAHKLPIKTRFVLKESASVGHEEAS
jgi:large subunit ribosomal protein L16